MTYQLRFESNAFEADTILGKLADALGAFKRTASRAIGRPIKEYEGDDIRLLRGINQRVFERAMDWADTDFDQQMANVQWEWKGPDGKTRRKNGETVYEPRDIIDTGNLLRSKKREQINRSTVDFTWEDPVAGAVHDGSRTKKGGINPARPWTEPTLADIDEVINSLINRRGR